MDEVYAYLAVCQWPRCITENGLQTFVHHLAHVQPLQLFRLTLHYEGHTDAAKQEFTIRVMS